MSILPSFVFFSLPLSSEAFSLHLTNLSNCQDSPTNPIKVISHLRWRLFCCFVRLRVKVKIRWWFPPTAYRLYPHASLNATHVTFTLIHASHVPTALFVFLFVSLSLSSFPIDNWVIIWIGAGDWYTESLKFFFRFLRWYVESPHSDTVKLSLSPCVKFDSSNSS